MSNPSSRADIYGRRQVVPRKPITADMCVIVWGAEGSEQTTTSRNQLITGVTNFSIQYQQQVIRRRTLGSEGGHPIAVIYPTQPIGSMQIQRLFCNSSDGTGPDNIFNFPGWNICAGTAALDISFNGPSAYDGSVDGVPCAIKYDGFHITGATVTGYNISGEAEGLTIVDNVSIEFLQLMAH